MAQSRVTKRRVGEKAGNRDGSSTVGRPAAAHFAPEMPKARRAADNEKVAYRQVRDEAAAIQLRSGGAPATADDHAEHGVLQAKMDRFWGQRLDRASRLGPQMGHLNVSRTGPERAGQQQPHAQRTSLPLRIQRSLADDFKAIEADEQTTKDPLLKSILAEALATAAKPEVTVRYGASKQKSHAQPIGKHGSNRGFDVVIDQTQYPDAKERQSIIVHELLHASSDSKYAFNAKFGESALTTPVRGNSEKEAFAFAGQQFRFAGMLATQLGQEAEKERKKLGSAMADHVIERAKRIAGSNAQEFDTVASELLYFMRNQGADPKTKTFRKVRNMAEAAYNARNGDIPITEGYLEPDSFKEFSVKSACFLTTACVYTHGLSDDCEELTVLRSLRDGYMRKREEDEELIALYYEVAPAILDGIMKELDRVQVLRSLYSVIRRCVNEVKTGRPERAVQIYRGMVERLQKRYAPGTLGGSRVVDTDLSGNREGVAAECVEVASAWRPVDVS